VAIAVPGEKCRKPARCIGPGPVYVLLVGVAMERHLI